MKEINRQPQNLERKIDLLIQLMCEFRDTILARVSQFEANEQARYLDLCQRLDKLNQAAAQLPTDN